MRPKRTMRNAPSAPAPRTARYSLRRRAFTAAGALTLIAFSAFSGALSAAAEIPAQPVMPPQIEASTRASCNGTANNFTLTATISFI